MTARRVSWWTRWPDVVTGPLWVGLHTDERGGRCVVTGVEIWTQPPGGARTDLGPPEALVDQLARSAPPALQRQHLELPLGRLVAAMAGDVAGMDSDLAELLRASHVGPGRPSLYDRGHYELVAGTYLRDGTSAVEVQWSVSNGTARGWVAQARRLGLLEPTAQPAG